MSKTERNGKARGGPKERLRASIVEDAEESVIEERDRLIRERQGTVEEVLDRHDDLVRAEVLYNNLDLLIYISRCENYSIWRNMCHCCPIILRYVLVCPANVHKHHTQGIFKALHIRLFHTSALHGLVWRTLIC